MSALSDPFLHSCCESGSYQCALFDQSEWSDQDKAREQDVASSLPGDDCSSYCVRLCTDTQHKQPKEREYLL